MSTETAPDTSQSTTTEGASGAAEGGTSTSSTTIDAAALATAVEASIAKMIADGRLVVPGANGAAKTEAGKTDATKADGTTDAAKGEATGLEARLAQLEAENKRNKQLASRAAVQAHLGAAISPKVYDLAPQVELTADGSLTAESIRALDAFKQSEAALFKMPSSTSPLGSTAGTKAKLSPETEQAMRSIGVVPGAAAKLPAYGVALALRGKSGG